MIDVNQNKQDFLKRHDYYQERIEQVIYPESEYGKINYTDQKQNENLTPQEILKKIRINLLNQKYNHTIRVTEMIKKLNDIMQNSEFITDISQISGLLHDYGRFIQAVYHSSYYEAEKFYKENGYNGHGEVGAHLLFQLGEIKNFHIEEKYNNLLEQIVKYHQINQLPSNLNIRIEKTFLKTTKLTRENQSALASLILQIVKDADMYDILYQRLIYEYPLFTDTINYHVNGMTINEIAKKTGISAEEIMEINQTTNIKNKKTIKLPFEKINPQELEVPPKIKDKFMKKVYIDKPEEWDLYTMQHDETINYNSITAMWWTIGQFIGNMNFTATLQLIKQEKLLQKIYELYPEKYKYLVSEMFSFAQEELLEKRINQGKIYAKK